MSHRVETPVGSKSGRLAWGVGNKYGQNMFKGMKLSLINKILKESQAC